MGFDDAGVDDVGQALFGLLFEEDAGYQLLFAGAKEFGLDKGIAFTEGGKIHLQLLGRGGSVDDQFAFLLCAGNQLVEGLRQCGRC